MCKNKPARDLQEKIWLWHWESESLFQGTVQELADGDPLCQEVSEEEAQMISDRFELGLKINKGENMAEKKKVTATGTEKSFVFKQGDAVLVFDDFVTHEFDLQLKSKNEELRYLNQKLSALTGLYVQYKLRRDLHQSALDLTKAKLYSEIEAEVVGKGERVSDPKINNQILDNKVYQEAVEKSIKLDSKVDTLFSLIKLAESRIQMLMIAFPPLATAPRKDII
jgi:hypothetical protein